MSGQQQVWIATSVPTIDQQEIRPVTSKADGLLWLVSQIDKSEWEHFLAALSGTPDADIVADLSPTPGDNDPARVIAAWYGDPDEDSEDVISWGKGMEGYARIERMTVWSAGDPA